MRKTGKIIAASFLFLFYIVERGIAQDREPEKGAAFSLHGQLSGWEHLNTNNVYPLLSGGRYIPRLYFEKPLKGQGLFDIEASANLYGQMGWDPPDRFSFDGKVKPYRFWVRYSTRQLEVRAGLQKINFGSASLLRPLMWFDQVDPRDPLRLTDGVWGLLGRYYFLNNANVWLWALMGNEDPKGWETIPSNRRIPGFGGRLQLPVPAGEAALSFHRRRADGRRIPGFGNSFSEIPENRIGFDMKLDIIAGAWVEGVWVKKEQDAGLLTNQAFLNAGADYTFHVGNGLLVVFEQLLAAYDRQPFELERTLSFSLLNISYPIGVFDQLSLISYYDWTNDKAYNFLNWRKQYNKISLYFMGYINPREYQIPLQGAGGNIFAGSGLQVMIVFNH